MSREQGIWSRDEEARLRRMADDGATVAEASRSFGRSDGSIRGKARTLGLVFAMGDKTRKPRVEAEQSPEGFIRPPAPVYRDRMAVMFGDPPIGRSALDQRPS